MSFTQGFNKLKEKFIVNEKRYLTDRYWELYYKIKEEIEELEIRRNKMKSCEK